LNETLFGSLAQARAVLNSSRIDNRTPEEFPTKHIAVAAGASNGQNFKPGLHS
jgi:hypothetical protein